MNPILVGLTNGCNGKGCDLAGATVLRVADIEKVVSTIAVNANSPKKGTGREENSVKNSMPCSP